MNAYVYLSIISAFFLVLGVYWKSRSALVFLMLAAGNVLSTSASGSVASRASGLVSDQSFPVNTIVKSGLLLLPALLAMLITKGSAKKKHAVINILISICTSVLGYLWFIRTLPYEQFSVIEAGSVSARLISYRDYVLGVGIILGLIYMIFDKKKKSDKHEKSKKD